ARTSRPARSRDRGCPPTGRTGPARRYPIWRRSTSSSPQLLPAQQQRVIGLGRNAQGLAANNAGGDRGLGHLPGVDEDRRIGLVGRYGGHHFARSVLAEIGQVVAMKLAGGGPPGHRRRPTLFAGRRYEELLQLQIVEPAAKHDPVGTGGFDGIQSLVRPRLENAAEEGNAGAPLALRPPALGPPECFRVVVVGLAMRDVAAIDDPVPEA